LKDQCVGAVLRSPGYNGIQYSRSCYSDIYVLWFFRGLDKEPVPYVHGDGVFDNEITQDGKRREVGDLEYPQGTGILVALAASVSRDAVTFFVWTALLLGASGVVSALLLAGLALDRRRILYFAAAPSLILYAFHNWDLAAVALMCGAFFLWRKRWPEAASGLAGIGAATKVFPGLLVPVFVAARWREDRRMAVRIMLAGIAGFAVVNVPFIVKNFDGWWGPWKFQSQRFANYDSTWFMVWRHLHTDFDHYRVFSSYASVLLLAAGVGVLVMKEYVRGPVRPYLLSYQLVLWFLLTGKVFSPQYALWVLPFFVILSIPWQAFAAFAVAEAAVWFAIASYLLVPTEFRLSLTEAAVWARFATLAAMLWQSFRARELIAADEPSVDGSRT
jgi:hypothetical protein